MILPIVAYGDPVLREVAETVDANYPLLKELIQNMFDTMYNAYGVGLAAPQIGISKRLFVIDAAPFADDEAKSPEERKYLSTFKRVFINPQIVEETGELWEFNEGCLSIPDVRENVWRHPDITVTYQDENFVLKTEHFTGLAARVIQHEYDHIEGILFTDRVTGLRKQLIKNKLENIRIGKTRPEYRMRYAKLKK